MKELQKQLKENTLIVERVRTDFGEKAWISQQVWGKKQEAYHAIFGLLLHIKRYVEHQVLEFEEWEYIHRYHPYFQNFDKSHEEGLRAMWEKDRKDFEELRKEPDSEELTRELKTKYDDAILELLQIVELEAIYISSEIPIELNNMRDELGKTYDAEDWDEHFSRLASQMDETINKVREISRVELKL